MMQKSKRKKGFTLLEILLVIAAIGILAAIVLVAINPNKQIESARAAKRKSDINTIIKSIGQYAIDNNGQYPGGIDTGARVICPTTSPPVGCVDLSLLSPDYIANIPEPDTGYYYIRRNSAGTSIEVTHPKDSIWNIGGTPSLDLNFASNKSLIDNASGNNLITFTRASTGTHIGEDGLIKTAAINEPRFDHNPITKESLGLLVEESRTNLATRSEEFQLAWTLASSNISQNTIIGPDGNQSADGVIANTVNTSHWIEINPTGFTTATNTTSSIFVKQGLGSAARLLVYGTGNAMHGVIFNFSTGVATFTNTAEYTSGGGVTTSWGAQDYGNGWWRLWVSGYPDTAATNRRFRILLSNESNVTSFAGDNASSYVHVWGAQLETGVFPTSYIPTTGSSVIRNADNGTISGTNFTSTVSNTSIGSFFIQGRGGLESTQNGYGRFIGFNGGGVAISRELLNTRIGIWDGSISTQVSNPSANVVANISKIGASFNSTTRNVALNGITSMGVSGVNIGSVFNQIALGRNGNNSNYLNGVLSRVVFFSNELSTTTLQALTQ